MKHDKYFYILAVLAFTLSIAASFQELYHWTLMHGAVGILIIWHVYDMKKFEKSLNSDENEEE